MLKRIARTPTAADWPRPDDISPLMHRLLRLRGIGSADEARAFLRPGRDQMHDPFLLSDMDKAVETILRAVRREESICVYGDYDVDGVCACAILVSYLKSIGAHVSPYLPSRHAEGYGLNEAAVRRIAEEHSLLVTVDCGITAVALARLAKEIGMAVVITDHHRPEGELPDCPVVNPLLNNYPFPYLCGTGVAFQLVAALGGRDAAMEYIDYAALATIADIVPLKDENRAIAALGLKKINASPRPGIRALIESAGLGAKPLNAIRIAFQLTPRLNASGRLGDAMRAYDLLTGRDIDQCTALATELDEENTRRRTLEQAAIDEAEKMLADFDFPAHRAIVVLGEGWNPGIIGLAASRLTEKYHYPSIVLTSEDDVLTGSCRSIDGVDIHDALTHVSDTLIQFGGHAMAAGLRLKKENLTAFCERLDAYLSQNIPAETWLPCVEYDAEVTPDMLSADEVRGLEALAPIGCGNPSPVFLMKCSLTACRTVGATAAHLHMTLRANGASMDSIWFWHGDLLNDLPHEADALFAASLNEYQGRVSVQAEMRALEPLSAETRLNDAVSCSQDIFQAFLTEHVYNNQNPVQNEIGAAELRALLSDSVQGTLIVAGSIGCARDVLEALGDDCPVDVTIGAYPDDPRCFHTLAVCPSGEIPHGYRNVILAGLPDDFMPGTARFADTDMAAGLRELPDVPKLREIYSAARRMSKRPYLFASLSALARSLSEDAVCTPACASAGLMILKHMNLIDIHQQGDNTRLEMMEMIKCDPEKDEVFQKLTKWRIAGKGGT